MKSVLLTGGTGFVGSYVLKKLVSEGVFVHLIKREKSNLSRILECLDSIKCHDIETLDFDELFKANNFDCIIHLACDYCHHNDSFSSSVKANLSFPLEVLDYALKYGVKYFINTDTFFNNGNIGYVYLSNYVLCKKQFLEWLNLTSGKINIINLRLHHVYGANDSENKFLTWFQERLKDNKDIELTPGGQKRDFIYVEDVASAFLIAFLYRQDVCGFVSVDVGAGDKMSLKQFLTILKKKFEDKNEVRAPNLLFGKLEYRSNEIMDVDVDNRWLFSRGWSPLNVEQGLNRLLNTPGRVL